MHEKLFTDFFYSMFGFYFHAHLLFCHQSSIATIETKFRQADEELLQLRSNLKHYEGLVDEYKSQVGTGNRK